MAHIFWGGLIFGRKFALVSRGLIFVKAYIQDFTVYLDRFIKIFWVFIFKPSSTLFKTSLKGHVLKKSGSSFLLWTRALFAFFWKLWIMTAVIKQFKWLEILTAGILGIVKMQNHNKNDNQKFQNHFQSEIFDIPTGCHHSKWINYKWFWNFRLLFLLWICGQSKLFNAK